MASRELLSLGSGSSEFPSRIFVHPSSSSHFDAHSLNKTAPSNPRYHNRNHGFPRTRSLQEPLPVRGTSSSSSLPSSRRLAPQLQLTAAQVPAAFFCGLGPHVYAVVAAGKAYDNTVPRDLKQHVSTATSLDEPV